MPAPTVGRTVLYKLNSYDVVTINTRRADFNAHSRANPRTEAGAAGATGHIGHTGNPARIGDECAATIVRVFPGSACANLQIHLDGNDTMWVTSAAEGDEPGRWMWPMITT